MCGGVINWGDLSRFETQETEQPKVETKPETARERGAKAAKEVMALYPHIMIVHAPKRRITLDFKIMGEADSGLPPSYMIARQGVQLVAA